MPGVRQCPNAHQLNLSDPSIVALCTQLPNAASGEKTKGLQKDFGFGQLSITFDLIMVLASAPIWNGSPYPRTVLSFTLFPAMYTYLWLKVRGMFGWNVLHQTAISYTKVRPCKKFRLESGEVEWSFLSKSEDGLV